MLISTVDGGHVIAGVAEYFGVPPPHVGSCQLSQDGWLAPTEVSFVECLTSYLAQHISTFQPLSSTISTTFLFLIDRYKHFLYFLQHKFTFPQDLGPTQHKRLGWPEKRQKMCSYNLLNGRTGQKYISSRNYCCLILPPLPALMLI